MSAEQRDVVDRLEEHSGECAACHRTASLVVQGDEGQPFGLCQRCAEARQRWGATLGRPLSVPETEAVMGHIIATGRGYPSIRELIDAAVRLGLIAP